MHFKIINLGETALPLSRFGLDLDDLVNRAVNFDLGGKTPLGRQDKKYELIGTVDELIILLKDTTNPDKNLPYILEQTCHVYGNPVNNILTYTYQSKAAGYLYDSLEEPHKMRAVKVLSQDASELNYLNPSNDRESLKRQGNLELLKPALSKNTGKLFDVKQEIYRLPDRLVYSFGLYYRACGNSVWEMVKQLEEQFQIFITK